MQQCSFAKSRACPITGPGPQMGRRPTFASLNPETAPLGPYLFFNVPPMAGTKLKNDGTHCAKSMHVCDVHGASGKKQIPKKTRLEQQTILVDPWDVLQDYRISTFHDFVTPKRGPKSRKGPSSGNQCFEIGPSNLAKRGHSGY